MRPRAFPERTLVMSTIITTSTPPTENNNKEQGWNRNTALCVDLKTILRGDRVMKPGNGYTGVLKRDVVCEDFYYDEHYTFVETLPSTDGKRNPQVFNGKYITVTCRDNGTYRLNFKHVAVGKGFNVDGFAIGVCNELREALNGLVEN